MHFHDRGYHEAEQSAVQALRHCNSYDHTLHRNLLLPVFLHARWVWRADTEVCRTSKPPRVVKSPCKYEHEEGLEIRDEVLLHLEDFNSHWVDPVLRWMAFEKVDRLGQWGLPSWMKLLPHQSWSGGQQGSGGPQRKGRDFQACSCSKEVTQEKLDLF